MQQRVVSIWCASYTPAGNVERVPRYLSKRIGTTFGWRPIGVRVTGSLMIGNGAERAVGHITDVPALRTHPGSLLRTSRCCCCCWLVEVAPNSTPPARALRLAVAALCVGAGCELRPSVGVRVRRDLQVPSRHQAGPLGGGARAHATVAARSQRRSITS